MPDYKTFSHHKPDSLIAGDFPIVTDSITIAAGQNLKRGAVLGKIQANGRYVLSAVAATDGSENPLAILAEDIDSANGDAESVCYLSGQFNSGAVVFGTGHTLDSTRHTLRLLNIYLTSTH